MTRSHAFLWAARIFGIGLHVPVLLIFIVQGIVVPTEGVLLLVAFWLAVLVAHIVLWRRRSYLVALGPVVDLIVLYGVTAAGRALFHWGAPAP
jgi:hypothetical protein